MKVQRGRGFTIIELLVVVSIIALLVGILLPAIGKARDKALQTVSETNLRNLGTAHATYASEWNDRQFTLVVDNISAYGNSAGAALAAYNNSVGSGSGFGGDSHPPLILGWGFSENAGYGYWAYTATGASGTANFGLMVPIEFGDGFGSFRIPNCGQFNTYLSGKFYDKVFYAPKDTVVYGTVDGNGCFEDPGEFSPDCIDPVPGQGDLPAWSSYCMSPAAMFNPSVMASPSSSNPQGFRDPWTIPAGFRSPAMGQARFSSLKTHMLEHNWLQRRQAECNSNFQGGPYENGCVPYFFNHSWDSNPVALFYDGHVESVGTREAERADKQVTQQSGEQVGLWHRFTNFGANGYFHNDGFDFAETSYHILTTDGILGRDLTAD